MLRALQPRLLRVGLSSLAALVASVSVPAQSVRVVSGGGNALINTVNLAQPGDTLLVQPGAYSALIIDSKAITVVADPPGGASVPYVRVSNTDASELVVVSGLSIPSQGQSECITIAQCAGPVRVEHVSVGQVYAIPVRATDSTNVAFVGCTVAAPFLPLPSPVSTSNVPGFHGLSVVNSSVALYDCDVSGGPGRDGYFNSILSPVGAAVGGDALRLDATSTVLASGCTLAGGPGGHGTSYLCLSTFHLAPPFPGARGGSSISVAAGGVAYHVGTTLVSGPGGLGGSGGFCFWNNQTYAMAPDGPDGTPTGNVISLAQPALRLDAPTHLREGQPLSIVVTGPPGESVWLVNSAHTRWELDTLYSGVFLFGPATRRVGLGMIPGTGVLNATLPAAALPAGIDTGTRHLQVLRRDAGGQLHLGSPSALVIVDAAF